MIFRPLRKLGGTKMKIIQKMMDKLDKKMEKQAKKKTCCCCQETEEDETCCKK